jgi:hypothetical protein
MNAKRKDMAKRSALSLDSMTTRQCNCLPLSPLHLVRPQGREDEGYEGYEQVIPVSQELGKQVHLTLEKYFPRTTPFSMLLLHVSQWEYKQVAQQSAIVHLRHRFHAPESFLEQVLTNVRRAIRTSDQFLTQSSAGAVLFFPDVDQRGIYSILERIYRNVSLLQAETVIPPLKYETDILLGIGSYPEPGTSIEHLLFQASVPAQQFTLRPAITPQFWGIATAIAPVIAHLPLEAEAEHQSGGKQKHITLPSLPTMQTTNEPIEIAEPMTPMTPMAGNSTVQVPFMHLPAQLPKRLKHLIPYPLALELHCAPVGRDHHYLTVALADPSDRNAIERLKDVTGMTIFPVCCNEDALNELLTQAW